MKFKVRTEPDGQYFRKVKISAVLTAKESSRRGLGVLPKEIFVGEMRGVSPEYSELLAARIVRGPR